MYLFSMTPLKRKHALKCFVENSLKRSNILYTYAITVWFFSFAADFIERMIYQKCFLKVPPCYDHVIGSSEWKQLKLRQFAL